MNRTTLASVWPPTAAIAQDAGQARISPMQAIRRKCLDCTGHQAAEVRLCEAVACPLWPFRAGRHPYTKRGLQEANSDQRASAGGPVPIWAAPSETALQEADFGEGVDNVGRAPSPPSRNDEAP